MNGLGVVRSCSRRSLFPVLVPSCASVGSCRIKGASTLLPSSSMAHNSMGWDAVLVPWTRNEMFLRQWTMGGRNDPGAWRDGVRVTAY